MPPYGSQPQTLAYRVEIEQSSLSEVVQQIQASVGQAMSSAIATVRGFAETGHATTAVAMGSVGGNLAFMEQQRARLVTQPTAASVGPAMGIASVAQAVAARAGLIEPGFSQTASGLSAAASATLREVKATIPEMMSKVGNFTSGVLNWASLVGLVPGLQPLGLALGAAGAAIELGTAGLDRYNEQESVRRMLMRYGDAPARMIVREIEDATRGMRNVGFDEAALVARSAIMNIGPENLNATQARGAVMNALQDWRMGGKLLGVTKEESLETTGALYRMGIRPGEGVQGLFGNTVTAAHALGVSTTALSAAGMQAAQMSMPLGYDALASQNQFMIQTATLAEAMRMGTVSASQRSMMAGFTGPQADQATAAATQYMASMRVLSGTGFGRIAGIGMMRGGAPGDMRALASRAAGASMEEILTYDIRSRRMMNQTTQDALEETLGSTIEEQIRAFRMPVNHDTLVAMAMQMHPDAFQTQGAAETFAMNRLQPWLRQRARATRMNRMAEAADEISRPAHGLAQMWDKFTSRTASGWAYMWSGQYDQGDAEYWTKTPDEISPYRGIRGWAAAAGRDIGISWGESIGRLWDSWEFSPVEGELFRSTGGTAGRGTARALFMRQSDISRMSDRELLDGKGAAVRAQEVLRENEGFVAQGDVIASFRRSREEVMSRAWTRADMGVKQNLDEMQERIKRDVGVDLTKDEARSLITNSFDLRRRIAGTTGEAREAILSSGVEQLRQQERFSEMSNTQLKGIVEQTLKFDVTQLVTEEEQRRLERDMGFEARRTSLKVALQDDEAWGAFASKVFKKDSKIASQIHAKRGILDEAGVQHLLNQAAIKGELSDAFMSKLDGKAGGVVAFRELLMAGSVGETKGVSMEDLPRSANPQAQAERIDELVKKMGDLTSAIQAYITETRVKQ